MVWILLPVSADCCSLGELWVLDWVDSSEPVVGVILAVLVFEDCCWEEVEVVLG